MIATKMMNNSMIGWLGSVLGPAGAIVLALNITISPFGYILFLASSVCMSVYAVHKSDRQVLLQNVLFSIINLVGVYRWLPVDGVLL